MIGFFNRDQSWEKQSIYRLENGWIATVEYSFCYGAMISRLDPPKGEEGKPWHASDGMETLPDFARQWIEVVVKSANTELVRPGFNARY